MDHRALTLDWVSRTATCLRGNPRTKWHPERDGADQEVIQLRLVPKDGRACEVRSACRRVNPQPRPRVVPTVPRRSPGPVSTSAHRRMLRTIGSSSWYGRHSLPRGAGVWYTLVTRYGPGETTACAKCHRDQSRVGGVWLADPRPTKSRISPFAALVASV